MAARVRTRAAIRVALGPPLTRLSPLPQPEWTRTVNQLCSLQAPSPVSPSPCAYNPINVAVSNHSPTPAIHSLFSTSRNISLVYDCRQTPPCLLVHIQPPRFLFWSHSFLVLGALLGTQNGREVEIVNTFEVAVEQGEKLDHGSFNVRKEQCALGPQYLIY